MSGSRQPCPTHPDHWRYPDSRGVLRCSACDGAACCDLPDACNWQAGECHCGAFQESWECLRASCTLTDDQHSALFAAIARAEHDQGGGRRASCATCWPRPCGDPPYRSMCKRREQQWCPLMTGVPVLASDCLTCRSGGHDASCERCREHPVSDESSGLCAACCDNNEGRVSL